MMRTLGAAALLAALFLTACTQAGGKQAPPPAPPAAEAAAAPTEPAIKPEELRVEPSFAVKVLKETNLYTGPGPYYLLIRTLPAGAAVTYLGNREGWLKAATAEGEQGWLTMADAALADGRGQPVTYRVQSGKWAMDGPGGFHLELSRVAAGVMRLTATGMGGGAAEVVGLGTGSAVAALVPVPGDIRTAADIGEAGIGRVSVSPRGILVDLEGAPLYQVVENQPGRLTLEFRPGLVSISRLDASGWQMTYRGDLRPVLRREGDVLVLDLPGAMVAPGLGGAPAGLELVEVGPEAALPAQPPSSPVAQPPSRMPAGGLRLRLPAPHAPYALYRPEPGQLQLRFLAPGLAGKTIVLDPGHGGEETGAVGPAGHIEKDVNLAVALKLKPLLEQAGARVIMTRTRDDRVLSPAEAAKATSAVERTQMDLAARVAMGKEAGADLFLSIHANGGAPSEGGTETYWATPNLNAELSRYLATLAQEELLRGLGLADRGVRQRPFNVIRLSDAPAALVELGFMTNAAEERLLTSDQGQEAAARALYRALERYFQ